jgi:hypothetical protein
MSIPLIGIDAVHYPSTGIRTYSVSIHQYDHSSARLRLFQQWEPSSPHVRI